MTVDRAMVVSFKVSARPGHRLPARANRITARTVVETGRQVPGRHRLGVTAHDEVTYRFAERIRVGTLVGIEIEPAGAVRAVAYVVAGVARCDFKSGQAG